MIRRRHVIALGCLVVLAGVVRGDTVDETIAALLRARRIPGLSLAIVDGGKIVKARGYGAMQAGGSEPVTADTLFQAGEVSMAVTAMGALHLVEARRLFLDEDVNRTLLSWELPVNEFTRQRKVTLRRLLSHGAGIRVNFRGYPPNAPLPTLAQVLAGRSPARTDPVRVDYEPGSKFEFASGGYAVVQQLIYDVTGEPFGEYMRRSVLEPLGMTASVYEQPLAAERTSRAATAHDGLRQPVAGGSWVYPELAAAGLWTTASDLARLVIGLQEALAGRDNRILSREMAAQMLTRQVEDCGLGLFLSGAEAMLRFDHGGRNNGFDTQVIAYAGSGRGAVVMLNTNDDTGAASRVLEAVARTYGWPEYPHRQRATAIEDANPEVTIAIRRIFELLRDGLVERAPYTRELAQAIAQRAGVEFRRELEPLGRIVNAELLEQRDENDHRVYRHRLVFEHESLIVTSTFRPDGIITALTFRPE